MVSSPSHRADQFFLTSGLFLPLILVVFRMSENAANENNLTFIVDLGNQPVMIPLDIKNRILANSVSVPPRFPDVV